MVVFRSFFLFLSALLHFSIYLCRYFFLCSLLRHFVIPLVLYVFRSFVCSLVSVVLDFFLSIVFLSFCLSLFRSFVMSLRVAFSRSIYSVSVPSLCLSFCLTFVLHFVRYFFLSFFLCVRLSYFRVFLHSSFPFFVFLLKLFRSCCTYVFRSLCLAFVIFFSVLSFFLSCIPSCTISCFLCCSSVRSFGRPLFMSVIIALFFRL